MWDKPLRQAQDKPEQNVKNWKRITLVIFVLIGVTMSFGFWSLQQFNNANNAFDNLSVAYLADTSQAYSFFKQRTELASTSPETSGEFATSTDPKLSFTFPQKGDEIYIGCTYQISWQSSTMVSSLEAALIDAGAIGAIGPKTSGLAKENTIEKESQNLNWKVGLSVWPGAYYIKVSKINGVEAVFRSQVFKISQMPKGIDEEEKINICRK